VVAWSGKSGDSASNGAAESSYGTPAPKVRAAASDAVRKTAPAIAVLDRRRAEIGLKHVLVVEDEPVQRQRIVQLTEPLHATATAVATGEEAVAALAGQKFDCVVVDLALPEMSGWQVIDHLRSKQNLRSTPVLVYTAKELTRKEVLKLGRATKTIVVKEVRSPERLQEEISAVLSKNPGDEVADSDSASIEISLAGKKVLVVDDDIRNIFALTALLERQGMNVIAVDGGADALETVRETGDIDIALIDVMMPEMDGYTTMSNMRSLPTFGERPIIALTAKAMKGDREKCIEAGASDYIAKPVDSSHLVGMLRSWLSH
jgi:CheY-like chemotaxis protein